MNHDPSTLSRDVRTGATRSGDVITTAAIRPNPEVVVMSWRRQFLSVAVVKVCHSVQIEGRPWLPSFRVEPCLKETMLTAADHERRTIANMVEVLIRDYCRRNGIAILKQGTAFDGRQKPVKRGK